jgi:hypothetical protein
MQHPRPVVDKACLLIMQQSLMPIFTCGIIGGGVVIRKPNGICTGSGEDLPLAVRIVIIGFNHITAIIGESHHPVVRVL